MFSKIMLFFTRFKVYAYVAVVSASFMAGCALTYTVVHARVSVLNAEIAEKKAELSTCRSANADNEKTIIRMSADREAAGKSCERQLAIVRRTAENNRRTDEKKPGGGNEQTGDGGVDNQGGSGGSSGDPLFDYLRVLFPVYR